MFFTQTLSSLVMNAKLERPLDSHTPQTEQLYWYDGDDWGETHEDEDYNASQWKASDVYHAEDEDEYNAYNAEEEADNTQVEVDPQSQDDKRIRVRSYRTVPRIHAGTA